MSYQDFVVGGAARRDEGKQDSSQAVAAGIFQINTSVSTFKRLINTLGTPKDTPELRDKLHKTRQYIGNLAKETSAKLKASSEADHGSEVNPGKKIADAKLAKDFQVVLKEFQNAQRTAGERETTYAPFVVQAVPSTYTASELNLTAEKRYDQEQQALLVEQRRQEVLAVENERLFNEALIEERDQGIEAIQQQIGEVHEIFKDLAVLVHEQGIMIDDIDSNIESSHAMTFRANIQLSKAARSQKSTSSLACLLLVIFGVALLIVIIVLAA